MSAGLSAHSDAARVAAAELVELHTQLRGLDSFEEETTLPSRITGHVAELRKPIIARIVELLTAHTVTKPAPNRGNAMTDPTPSRAPLTIADYTLTEWTKRQERHIHRIFDAFDGLSEDRRFPEASLAQLMLELAQRLPPHRQAQLAHLLNPLGNPPVKEAA